uniref:Uncharacterized protein n=1 Tax=Arundo donax TaxID=35708 RepID=A0A0A9B904_ARUDO
MRSALKSSIKMIC